MELTRIVFTIVLLATLVCGPAQGRLREDTDYDDSDRDDNGNVPQQSAVAVNDDGGYQTVQQATNNKGDDGGGTIQQNAVANEGGNVQQIAINTGGNRDASIEHNGGDVVVRIKNQPNHSGSLKLPNHLRQPVFGQVSRLRVVVIAQFRTQLFDNSNNINVAVFSNLMTTHGTSAKIFVQGIGSVDSACAPFLQAAIVGTYGVNHARIEANVRSQLCAHLRDVLLRVILKIKVEITLDSLADTIALELYEYIPTMPVALYNFVCGATVNVHYIADQHRQLCGIVPQQVGHIFHQYPYLCDDFLGGVVGHLVFVVVKVVNNLLCGLTGVIHHLVFGLCGTHNGAHYGLIQGVLQGEISISAVGDILGSKGVLGMLQIGGSAGLIGLLHVCGHDDLIGGLLSGLGLGGLLDGGLLGGLLGGNLLGGLTGIVSLKSISLDTVLEMGIKGLDLNFVTSLATSILPNTGSLLNVLNLCMPDQLPTSSVLQGGVLPIGNLHQKFSTLISHSTTSIATDVNVKASQGPSGIGVLGL